jgi:spore germination protein
MEGLNLKKRLWIILTIALIGTGVWGYDQYQKNMQHNIYLENQFQRMFYDLMLDMENVQVNLAKIMVAGTPRQNVMVLSEIRYLCYDAQEKLCQLPIEHANVSRTQKFLSQVGDYSMAMARKNLEGKPLNDKEMKTLKELHNYSNHLSKQLIDLQNKMAQNGTKIGELTQKGNKKIKKANQDLLKTSFLNVEEKMQKYPKLIYDGPFSEHVEGRKSNLNGKKITSKQAQRIAESFLDDIEYKSKVTGEITNSRIPGYLIELSYAGGKNTYEISAAVSNTGGKIIWLLNNRNIGKLKITEKRGIAISQEFLKRKGYSNMVPTYFVKNDGQLLINFAYKDGETIVYTDLIKVKVGLDEGDIIGFEAAGYLFNHHKRSIETPKIDANEAKEKINIFADVSQPRLAIIPTEAGDEILCYEFRSKFNDDIFLIYIDANTGEEQKILQVVIKDEGVLML